MILWYCIASSFLFGITALIAFVHKQYFLSAVLFALSISSVIHHSQRLYHSDKYLFTTSLQEHNKRNIMIPPVWGIDKILAYMAVFTTLYLFYQKVFTRKWTYEITVVSGLVVLGLSYIVYIWYYGYYVNEYCFHPIIYIAEKYHMLIHVVGACLISLSVMV